MIYRIWTRPLWRFFGAKFQVGWPFIKIVLVPMPISEQTPIILCLIYVYYTYIYIIIIYHISYIIYHVSYIIYHISYYLCIHTYLLQIQLRSRDHQGQTGDPFEEAWQQPTFFMVKATLEWFYSDLMGYYGGLMGFDRGFH